MLLLAVVAALVGLAFAGSAARVAEGVTIAGVDVGGLTRREAIELLEGRAGEVFRTPIVFTAGDDRYPITAATLGVEADWPAALETALGETSGFGPVRGYQRLQKRFFGTEISPPVHAYTAALDYKLGQIATATDRPHVEAKLVRRGLSIVVFPGQVGQTLERETAADTLVRALARLDRARQVALPVSLDPVEVSAAELAPAARQARLALSAPVRLEYEGTRWKLPRWRIAELLALPSGTATGIAIAGPGAAAWFSRLRKTVERAPVDAGFRTSDGVVAILPAKPGLQVNIPATAKALLTAATSPTGRSAALAVTTSEPRRSTEDAQAMGIERRLSTYTTSNAGTFNRITNLRRGIELLNGALVPPGGTFSLNERVGERTLERGFLPAPVIIGDKYEEDVGGGVSQVATTVFNAAWEAGVKIVERNPHSLFISRYQLGRDATINYPDLDLRFVNDTPKWILVSSSWDGGGITVALYGSGPERRVESGEATVRLTDPPRVRRTPDPTLQRGTEIVEEEGSDGRVTSVTRTVYDDAGNVLSAETWNTTYRGEYRIIRVGTKPKPKPAPKKPKPTPTEPTPTEPTPTEPTTTSTEPAIPSFDEITGRASAPTPTPTSRP